MFKKFFNWIKSSFSKVNSAIRNFIKFDNADDRKEFIYQSSWMPGFKTKNRVKRLFTGIGAICCITGMGYILSGITAVKAIYTTIEAVVVMIALWIIH